MCPFGCPAEGSNHKFPGDAISMCIVKVLNAASGRGSFRKLQKALRVGKVKDKLPEMTATLEGALAEWKQVLCVLIS